MSATWARNLYLPTAALTDAEMADIPSPLTELYIHVTCKTVQAGTILGMGIIGPVLALVRRRPFASTCLKAGQIGALIGVPAGPAMTTLVLNKTKSTEQMIWDRCYRLRYNRNQVRVDRAFSGGALAGAGLGAVVGGLTPVSGAVLGIFVATVGAGVYNNSGLVGEESVVNPHKKEAAVEEKEPEKKDN